MKKHAIIIFLVLFSFIKTAHATIHIVYVSGIGINPVTTTAICGDTIRFTWNGGTDSTRSTTIPSCASPWVSPLDATTHTYSLTLACGGTYNYSCYVLNGTTKTYTAVINVSCGTTGISTNQTPQLNIYPNPAQNNFTVHPTTADDNQTVQVFDLTGNLILTQNINGITNIEANLPEGVYILTLTNNQGVTNKRLIIVK